MAAFGQAHTQSLNFIYSCKTSINGTTILDNKFVKRQKWEPHIINDYII